MTDDQPRRSRGRRPIVTGVDLVIGAADADRERFDEDGAVRGRRLRHLIEPRGAGNARSNRKREHVIPSKESRSAAPEIERSHNVRSPFRVLAVGSAKSRSLAKATEPLAFVLVVRSGRLT